jgi:hypothetical protein
MFSSNTKLFDHLHRQAEPEGEGSHITGPDGLTEIKNMRSLAEFVLGFYANSEYAQIWTLPGFFVLFLGKCDIWNVWVERERYLKGFF